MIRADGSSLGLLLYSNKIAYIWWIERMGKVVNNSKYNNVLWSWKLSDEIYSLDATRTRMNASKENVCTPRVVAL